MVLFIPTFGYMDVQVYDNEIMNAGNSAFGALNIDLNNQYNTVDACGTQLGGNSIFVGQDSHVYSAINLGTNLWSISGSAWNVSLYGNRVGAWSAPANVGIGIAVAGVCNAQVEANELQLNLISGLTSVSAPIAIDLSIGDYSSSSYSCDFSFSDPDAHIIENDTKTRFTTLWNKLRANFPNDATDCSSL